MALFVFRLSPRRNEHRPLSVMQIGDTRSLTLTTEKQEQCSLSAWTHLHSTKCPCLSDPVLHREASQLGRDSRECENKLSVAKTEERTTEKRAKIFNVLHRQSRW